MSFARELSPCTASTDRKVPPIDRQGDLDRDSTHHSLNQFLFGGIGTLGLLFCWPFGPENVDVATSNATTPLGRPALVASSRRIRYPGRRCALPESGIEG